MRYQIYSMGGRLLAEGDHLLVARRVARGEAARRGCYVELHHPDGYVDYIYPEEVAS